MNILSLILTIVGTAAEAAKGLTPSGDVAAQDVEKLAASLARIAAAANSAHVQIKGQPIDLSQLTDLPPV